MIVLIRLNRSVVVRLYSVVVIAPIYYIYVFFCRGKNFAKLSLLCVIAPTNMWHTDIFYQGRRMKKGELLSKAESVPQKGQLIKVVNNRR